MSKAMVYAVNTTTQTVAPNGSVNFGTPVRRYGCSCTVRVGTPVTNGVGYYKFASKLLLTSTAGTITLTWYKDGVPVPGAFVQRTVVADTIYEITDQFVIREKCCCDDDSIYTLVITGTTATITDATVIVERM